MSNNFKPLSEQVADKLIQQLKDGKSIFQKNDARPLIMPFNANTGKNYKGVPALILLLKQEPDPRWLTLEQGNFSKNNVIKDEKGTLISFYKTRDMQRLVENGKEVLKENGKPKMISVKLDEPVLTTAFLFNAKQLKDMPELAPVLAERAGTPTEERINDILINSGLSTDKLGDSPQAALKAIVEHLIAEKPNESSIKDALKTNIAALFISAELQIPFDIGDHTGYTQSWQQLLKEEPAELFKAANDAQKIAEKVIGFEKKRINEQQQTATLNKGDVIQYKGDTIKVLNILKGKTAQVENSDRAKFKVGPKDGLYTALVAAKNNAPEQNTERNAEQNYAMAR
ncbi:ArdC-like ssDNA-binding domain-containing protein [Mucilaginibacter phyllosphaerae]